MTQYVALLRAVNVGGRFVKMDRLRRLFEQLGLARVETFIGSGNVIFESRSRDPKRLEARISRHLKQALGYDVATFVRTRAEIAEVARYKAFRDVPAGGGVYVGFFPAPLGQKAARAAQALNTDVEQFRVRGRELYWLYRVRSMEMLTSLAQLERTLGLRGTFRTANTVRRLAAKYPPIAPEAEAP